MAEPLIALTTFATTDFSEPQLAVTKSALEHGARQVSMWRPEDLRRTSFYERHRDILDRPRGAGYWLWKPYVILAELEKLRDGDVLIYTDCGKPENPLVISRPLAVLAQWSRDHCGGMTPGVYVPHFGRNAVWTKGECFSVMNCNSRLYHDHPQMAATFSVWEKHEASLDFVRTWLSWCTVPAALVDDQIDPAIPNAPDFCDHRHDQSILTLLAIKRGLKCIGAPWEEHKHPKKIDSLIDRIEGRAKVFSHAELFPSLLTA